MAERPNDAASSYRGAIASVEHECAEAGLDVQLTCEFSAKDAVDAGLLPGSSIAAATALLLASSRNLWPPLERWTRRHFNEGRRVTDPVDEYTEQVVGEALKRAALPHQTYFAHRRYDGRYVGFQRLGERLGLAAVGPVHLAIHPIYGPWFGYRALVVFDACKASTVAPPPATRSVCAGCLTRPCVPRFNALKRPDGKLVALDANSFQAWADVRRACPVGKAWTYGASQIEYHYTKQGRLLRP